MGTLSDFWDSSWRAPPWRVPRALRSDSDRQQRADLNRLLKRLKFVHEFERHPKAYIGDRLYVDPDTGQKWLWRYHEWGFGSWESIEPVDS
jgi:hypothetical protein